MIELTMKRSEMGGQRNEKDGSEKRVNDRYKNEHIILIGGI